LPCTADARLADSRHTAALPVQQVISEKARFHQIKQSRWEVCGSAGALA